MDKANKLLLAVLQSIETLGRDREIVLLEIDYICPSDPEVDLSSFWKVMQEQVSSAAVTTDEFRHLIASSCLLRYDIDGQENCLWRRRRKILFYATQIAAPDLVCSAGQLH